MTTVLIIGASKGIGLEAVKAALNEGYRVVAFARSAAGIPIEHERLTKMPGDALSTSDIAKALVGVDAVIQSLGVATLGELAKGSTLFSQSTRILIDRMKADGPKRLIAVTGLGAGNSRGRLGFFYDRLLFPLLLARIYADKDVAEQMIAVSGLEWTIARPGMLTNGPATLDYKVLPDMKDWRYGSISRVDVAEFLIRQISDRRLLGKTPLLIG
jgi:putative NADH-flavin reductase